MTKTLLETTTAQQVAAALRNMFDPRELTVHSLPGDVAFGFAWAVHCEPHSHWHIRIGLKHDGQATAEVRHPGEGTTLDRTYDSTFNMGQILADVAGAVPVRDE